MRSVDVGGLGRALGKVVGGRGAVGATTSRTEVVGGDSIVGRQGSAIEDTALLVGGAGDVIRSAGVRVTDPGSGLVDASGSARRVIRRAVGGTVLTFS